MLYKDFKEKHLGNLIAPYVTNDFRSLKIDIDDLYKRFLIDRNVHSVLLLGNILHLDQLAQAKYER